MVKKKKVLILGGTGMLGHTLLTQLSLLKNLDVYATARTSQGLSLWFCPDIVEKIRSDVDANNFDTVIRAFASIQPEIVINCIGLIKQLPISNDPLSAITINSLLPHRISMVCRSSGMRLIHISTDCVFGGKKGNYAETDLPDSKDLYGRTKFLGEVTYPPHCLTLRTSIIGHELKGKLGFLEWFLAQKEKVKGFSNAIFSGFPTVELAHIITDYILTDNEMTGMYHLSSDPISKYDLLKLIAEKYSKQIEIEKYDDFYQDLSLDSSAFNSVTGYKSPGWRKLVDKMYTHYISASCYSKHREKED